MPGVKRPSPSAAASGNKLFRGCLAPRLVVRQRFIAHLRRRTPIAAAEHAIEVGHVAEAGGKGNVRNLAMRMARARQEPVGAGQAQGDDELHERGALGLEQPVDGARRHALPAGDRHDGEVVAGDLAHDRLLDRHEPRRAR